jgi:hypothetical protein
MYTLSSVAGEKVGNLFGKKASFLTTESKKGISVKDEFSRLSHRL